MKKSIFVLLLSSLCLVGCSNQKVAFKTYKFGEQLTSTEKQRVVAEVRSKMSSVNGFETITTSETHHKNNNLESNARINYSFYDSYHIHRVTTSKSSSTNGGITLATSNSITYDSFYSATNSALISFTNNKKEGVSFGVNNDYNVDNLTNSIYSNIYSSFLNSMMNLNAYKDGNNYYFAISNISETVSAVQWGDKTKELKTISRSQTICKVNSSFKIVSAYSMSEGSTNKDPDTGEWYSKVKQVSFSSTRYNVRYGSISSGESIKNAILSQLNNGFIQSAEALLDVKNHMKYNLTCSLKYKDPKNVTVSFVFNNSDYGFSSILFKPIIRIQSKENLISASNTIEVPAPLYELGNGIEIIDVGGEEYLNTTLNYMDNLFFMIDVTYLSGNITTGKCMVYKG